MLLGFSHIAMWRTHSPPTILQRCNFVTCSRIQCNYYWQGNSRQQDISCLNATTASSNLSNSSCPSSGFEPKGGLDGLIEYLAQHPPSEWHPDIIRMHEIALTRVGEYEAAMNRHKHRARLSSEDMKVLNEVDGFLMGFAKQMRRVAARKTISAVLLASTIGPEEFDKKVKEAVDSDSEYVHEFLTEVIETEKRKQNAYVNDSKDGNDDDDEPQLLKVLGLVKDRIQAEVQLRGCRPEVNKLAYAMQISSDEGRTEYLRHPETFQTIEDLQNFARFVENGVKFIGGGKGAPSSKSNLHPDKIDTMCPIE